MHTIKMNEYLKIIGIFYYTTILDLVQTVAIVGVCIRAD